MLSITRLPALSVPKIQQKLIFLLKNGVVEKHINKQCQNDIVKLCRSFSVLHSLTNKSKNPVSAYWFKSGLCFLLKFIADKSAATLKLPKMLSNSCIFYTMYIIGR